MEEKDHFSIDIEFMLEYFRYVSQRICGEWWFDVYESRKLILLSRAIQCYRSKDVIKEKAEENNVWRKEKRKNTQCCRSETRPKYL
jgi:hypothetical protein